MLSRRSLFSLFAGTAAVAAGAKVVESKPLIGVNLAALGTYPTQSYLFRVIKSSHTHQFNAGTYERMSRHFADVKGMEIPKDRSEPRPMSQILTISEEHQPVNMRSDGSIRHRQHHPVDFPPKR